MAARGFKTWCENTAAGLRRDVGVLPHDPLPPVRLAEHLGIVVWRVDEVPGLASDALAVLVDQDPDSWSAVTLRTDAGSVIIVNSAHSDARLASSTMHELAHLVLEHDGTRVDITPDQMMLLHGYDKEQENDADWLAGCLLLPRVALLRSRELKWSDTQITAHYGVSRDMLTYRLRMTAVDSQMARRRPR